MHLTFHNILNCTGGPYNEYVHLRGCYRLDLDTLDKVSVTLFCRSLYVAWKTTEKDRWLCNIGHLIHKLFGIVVISSRSQRCTSLFNTKGTK